MFSCSKTDNLSSDIPEKGIVEIKEQAKQKAYEEWITFLRNYQSPFQDEVRFRASSQCDCSYTVTNITITGNPIENSELTLNTPFNQFNPTCNWFTGVFIPLDPEECNTMSNPTRCVEHWDVPNEPVTTPSTYYPFNGLIPSYSIFNVSFESLVYPDLTDCLDINFHEFASISFIIRCSDVDQNAFTTDCPTNTPGQSFYSNEITISFDDSLPLNIGASTNIELQDCGCNPIEIE